MPDPADFISASEAKAPLYVGIDVGGTNIKIGVIDDDGETLAYQSIATEQQRGPVDAARRIGSAAKTLLQETGVADGAVARAGLATPGPMDLPSGILLIPGNLPEWHNCPIRDLVAEACGLPVTYANDANAAAYGEYWLGAGREARSMVLFTLGTGIGGGIVTEGVLIEGIHSCGGELGHIIIDSSADAPLNTLGIRGTLEGYCGAYAVIGRTEALLAGGAASSVRGRIEAGEQLSPKLLAEEAESGDELATNVILDTARYLALGVVSAVHCIDPESVVLAGAMTFGGAGHSLGEQFIAHVREHATERMIASLRGKVHIDFARLGGDAGFIGAAGLARREHEQN